MAHQSERECETIMGRPSKYTQKTADSICERLAEGEPLRQICRDENMPAWRTVYDWKDADAEFSARIVRAREAGFDAIAHECLEIADETGHDTLLTEHGDRANTEWISRSKLRVETRLKLLAKWDPKRYGDKVTQEHMGSLRVMRADELSDDELASIAAASGN